MPPTPEVPDPAAPSPEQWRVPSARKFVAPIAAVVVLGCLLSLLLGGLQAMSLQSAANDAAESVVATDAIETSDAIRELDGVMQSLAAVFHAEGDIGQARFRRLTRDLLANHPSVQALQYSVVVPDRHRKAFERELRAAGLGSSINDPTPEGIRPAGQRPDYVAIKYTEPVRGNRQVFGLDITYRPQNRRTLEVARDTGEVQVGGRTQIVQGGGQLEAIHIYAPIYRPGTRPATVRQRHEDFVGVAGAVVVYDRLMSKVAPATESRIADLALLDREVDGQVVLWTSDGAAGTSAEELANWPAQAAIPLPGRDLLMVGRPSQAYWASLGLWRVIVAGAVGLLVTALLAFLLWQRMDARRFRSMARELHDASDRLRYLAERDPLTGLPHRAGLRAWADDWIETHPGEPLAVLFVDLDDFKDVNSTWGHPAGDDVLREIGRRLGEIQVDEGQLVARLGGDEFVVVASLDSDEAEAEVPALCRHVQETVSRPLAVQGGRELLPTASIGVATYPVDGAELGSLLVCADTAVRHAKSMSRGRAEIYTPALAARVQARHEMETELRRAVGDLDHSFTVHYQPQIDMWTGQVIGVEALLRWPEAPPGVSGPADFIGVAERIGLIEQLGSWVLAQSVARMAEWSAAGLPPIRMAVNAAAEQLTSGSLVADLEALARDHRLEPGLVEIEVTESTAMAPDGNVRLRQVQQLGVTVAIDDFGTGYSSLSRLSQFPASRLKIDRAFVADLTTSPKSLAIVRAIVALAEAVDLEVVAEGVETADQAMVLVTEGVRLAQGYWYSRPVPAAEIEELVARGFPHQVIVPEVAGPPTG